MNRFENIDLLGFYNNGMSMSEMIHQFKTHARTIKKELEKRGCKFRTRSEVTQNTVKKGRQRVPKGKDHYHWKGGKTHAYQGYVKIYCPEHHRAVAQYVLEHILIWENTYKKELPKGYIIHHLNGIKNDNRPENLIVMKAGEHINQTKPYQKRIVELEQEIIKLRQGNLKIEEL